MEPQSLDESILSMDESNQKIMAENFCRFNEQTVLAYIISDDHGEPKQERFKNPIPNEEKVKERLVDLGFKKGPWFNAKWDGKKYVIPQKSSSGKKGGFSRKNKKGKKRKGISLKNRISKVRG